jgi:hypothetical protein
MKLTTIQPVNDSQQCKDSNWIPDEYNTTELVTPAYLML